MSARGSAEFSSSSSMCQHNASSSQDLSQQTAGKNEFPAVVEIRFDLDSDRRDALHSYSDVPPELKEIENTFYCNIFMEDSTLVVNWTAPKLPPKSLIYKVTRNVQAFIRKIVEHVELRSPKFSATVVYPEIRNERLKLLLDGCRNSKFYRYADGWQMAEVSGTRVEVDESLKCIFNIVTNYTEEKYVVGEVQYKFLHVALKCDRFLRMLHEQADTVDVQSQAYPCICLNGPKDKVEMVGERIVQAVSKLVNVILPCPTSVFNWLDKEHSLDHLQRLLIQRNITAALQIEGGVLYAYADSTSTVESAKAILKDEVIWQPLEVKLDDLSKLLSLHRHKDELSRILKNKAELVVEEQIWHLICWREDVSEIRINLDNFLKKNLLFKRKVMCSKARSACIDLHCKADFEAIAGLTDPITLMKLQITSDSDGFLLVGNSELVECGQQKLTQLIRKVEKHLFTVDVVPNAQDLLKGRISEIEQQTGTIIQLLDPDSFDLSTGYPSTSEHAEATLSSNERSESAGVKATTSEDIMVLPKWTELCDVQADVLVNSIGWELDLNHGNISRSLGQRAGPSLQNELNRRFPQGLEFFQYAVTKSHNVGCRAIIHVTCAPYCGKYTEDMLFLLFVDCLKEAEKRKATSIAFPAIGTGNLNYQPVTVFKLLHDAVAEFRKAHKTASLREVYCSLMDPKHREPFEECSRESLIRGTQKKSSLKTNAARSPVLCIPINKSVVQITQSTPTRKSHVVIRFDRTKKASKDSAPSGNNPGCVHIDKDVDLSKLQTALESAIRSSESFKSKSLSIVVHKNDKGTARCMTETLLNYCKLHGSTITEISLIVDDNQLSTYCQTLLATCYQPNYPRNETSWLDRLNRLPLLGSAFAYLTKQMQKSCDTSDDTLVIAIYSTSVAQVKEAEVQLSNLLSQECVIEVLNCHPGDVSILDDKQISALAALGSSCKTRINLHVEQSKIFIRGCRKDEVDRAREKVQDFLASARQEWYQSEMKRHMLERAKVLVESVQWQYRDDSDTWTNFEEITNMQIENSNEKATSCLLVNTSIGDFYYNPVNFPMSVSAVDGASRKTYHIRRIDVKGWREFPKEWTYCETYLECTLQKDAEEYTAIESEFLNNAGASANEVLEIKRIQDPHAWKMLKIQEQKVKCFMLDQFEPCTRRLWHGTSPETVSAILKDRRFNRDFAGDGVLYGKGVYFARDASYAAQPQYARASGGVSTIILAEVVTGCFTKGTPSTTFPPKKLDNSNSAYDSTVDDEHDPSIFVIYHDAQAYPLYVIRFK